MNAETETHDTQLRPPPFVVEEQTLEDRLKTVCVRLEAATLRVEAGEKRLQIGDHMMALLEHDNSMCLYALRAFAKKLEAEEVEEKLAAYIEDRSQLLQEIREALNRITVAPTPPPEASGD